MAENTREERRYGKTYRYFVGYFHIASRADTAMQPAEYRVSWRKTFAAAFAVQRPAACDLRVILIRAWFYPGSFCVSLSGAGLAAL